MRRDDALAILGAHREEIAAFGVSALSLFGLIARDEAGPQSDADLLGRPVDLVVPDAVKRQLRDSILSDAIRAAKYPAVAVREVRS